VSSWAQEGQCTSEMVALRAYAQPGISRMARHQRSTGRYPTVTPVATERQGKVMA